MSTKVKRYIPRSRNDLHTIFEGRFVFHYPRRAARSFTTIGDYSPNSPD